MNNFLSGNFNWRNVSKFLYQKITSIGWASSVWARSLLMKKKEKIIWETKSRPKSRWMILQMSSSHRVAKWSHNVIKQVNWDKIHTGRRKRFKSNTISWYFCGFSKIFILDNKRSTTFCQHEYFGQGNLSKVFDV